MTSETADPRPITDQGPTPSYPQDTGPNLKAEALRCALRGWAVLPLHSISDGVCTCPKGEGCGSPGKHPRTRTGVKEASTDAPTIVSWWTWWPDANIGIATGAASDVFVLDVDPDHGGDASLDALISEHGHPPDTVEAQTGGGGRHIYLTYEGAEGIGNSVSKLGPGLDIRTDGGYVVAPPSAHASGRRYEWEASSHPGEVALARPPQWIVDALTPTSGDSSQPDGGKSGDDRIDPAAVLAGMPEGERNDTLFRFVSRHRGLGLSREEAATLALAAGRACDPPLHDGEARRIVHNVYDRYESGLVPDYSLPNEAAAPGTPQDRFPIHWGNAIEGLPAPEWLIDGIMTKGSFVVLYGPPGYGKTFIALDMARAIATGQPWLGSDVAPGRVIYIAAEGVGDLGLRHEALRVAYDLGDMPDLGYLTEPVNFFSGSDVHHLISMLSERPPALVVVDTLARSMDGGDENVVKDMNAVIKSADGLRHETGAAVMLIHHTGHDRSRERGSSALKGAADVFMKLKGRNADSVTMDCDKMKMAAPFDDITIRFEATRRSLAVVSQGVRPILTVHEREGLTLVSTEPKTHTAWLEVFERTGQGSKSTFNRTLKALKDKGYVKRGGGATNSEYTITDTGLAALGLTSINEVSEEK